MKPVVKYCLGACLAGLSFAGCQREDSAPVEDFETVALREADGMLTEAARMAGVTREALMQARAPGRFTAQQNVFFPGALAIDIPRKHVTLPLYQGIGPSGQATYFIITEAANFNVAKRLGVNYSPKLVYGRDTPGSQRATIVEGKLKFEGDVDFSPVRAVQPGPFPNTFPPALAQPGAVGDARYSPLVVLPSGSVFSMSIVANSTGTHDHLVSIDYAKGSVVFEMLDGFEGGAQFYYHLVTESSDMGAATIERGTYTPRLANLPIFGQNQLADKSALLGFSPVANGETGANNPERQGLNSTILDGTAFDPINVFPLDPDNAKQEANNYSPMWDAHICAWTPQAIQAGQRRRIKSVAELEQLIREGKVTDAPANMGAPNAFMAGLKPSRVIINCPVIAQPQ